MHHFESTTEAYDATQCGIRIEHDDAYTKFAEIPVRNGEVLVIASEGVVGLCDTWPYAVTEESGSLHKVNRDGWAGLTRDRTVTVDQLRAAAAEALHLGFPLDRGLLAFLEAQRATEAEQPTQALTEADRGRLERLAHLVSSVRMGGIASNATLEECVTWIDTGRTVEQQRAEG